MLSAVHLDVYPEYTMVTRRLITPNKSMHIIELNNVLKNTKKIEVTRVKYIQPLPVQKHSCLKAPYIFLITFSPHDAQK